MHKNEDISREVKVWKKPLCIHKSDLHNITEAKQPLILHFPKLLCKVCRDWQAGSHCYANDKWMNKATFAREWVTDTGVVCEQTE